MYHWSVDMCWVRVSYGSVRMKRITAAQTPSLFTAVFKINIMPLTLSRSDTVSYYCFPTFPLRVVPQICELTFFSWPLLMFVYFCCIFMGFSHKSLSSFRQPHPLIHQAGIWAQFILITLHARLFIWERPKAVLWNIFGAGLYTFFYS